MKKQKLVILGAGFASYRLALAVSRMYYEITIISPRDHFLFTPLLASTTVGTTEFRSIIEPINLRHADVKTYLAFCNSIDSERKIIKCQSPGESPTNFEVQYDILVIGVGAVSATYGIKGVEQYAMPLKELRDARKIRQHIIQCIERASLPDIDEEERRRLLHFVVVGGGPTGVEFAGEVYDFITQDLAARFPGLSSRFRISLVDAGPTLLSSFDADLGRYTQRIFRNRNIAVKTSSFVKEVRANELELADGNIIKYGTLIWSAGISPTPFVKSLNYEKDKLGRIFTNEYLQVIGQDNIYAVGDCACVHGADNPMTAQLAQQQGKYLAKTLNSKPLAKKIKPFVYLHVGMMAYIGGKRGLADTPNIKWRGFFAWVMWRSVYITKLISFRNKVRVLFDWAKASIFGRDITTF